MMKAKTLEQCTIEASGSYLCEYLPDNFEAMDEEVLYELIESIAWEPFEHYSGKDLMKEIAGSGSTIFRDQPDVKTLELFKQDMQSDVEWEWLLVEMGVIEGLDTDKEAKLYNRVRFEALNIQGDMA
jgi:hypothetical protein